MFDLQVGRGLEPYHREEAGFYAACCGVASLLFTLVGLLLSPLMLGGVFFSSFAIYWYAVSRRSRSQVQKRLGKAGMVMGISSLGCQASAVALGICLMAAVLLARVIFVGVQ